MPDALLPELAILIGLPGSGKTSFYGHALARSHVHVSKDLMPSRRDRQTRQLALIDEALASGRSVAVDNVNAAVADRTALIAIARGHRARIVGYQLRTAKAECLQRNSNRTGRERIPAVAIHAAAKRLQEPTLGEGFDRLYTVDAVEGGFRVAPIAGDPPPDLAHSIFLLSPASTSGERAVQLLNDAAAFPLARQLRTRAGAPLGDVFSFLSSLYFRGKLTYARAFGRAPAGLCGAFVITPGEGLRDPAEPITITRLRTYARVRIRPGEPRYLTPLLRDAHALATLAGGRCRIILLGSIASPRYVEPLLEVFGERLLYPPSFIGRGDMSRGGLLLRCVDAGQELEYAPLANAVRHGPRPARLPKRTRPSRQT